MPAGLLAIGSAVIGFAFIGCWAYALVDVVRIPEWQFGAVESNKLFWIVVIGLLTVVGGVLWWFAARERVLAAGDGRIDPDELIAPAGWYRQPGAAALRWWDGRAWTDRYDTWSGAPS